MAKLEVKRGKLQFVGGSVDGLEVNLDKTFWKLPKVRNRNFAETPNGRIRLTSFLSAEQEDEERYDADYARWR